MENLLYSMQYDVFSTIDVLIIVVITIFVVAFLVQLINNEEDRA